MSAALIHRTRSHRPVPGTIPSRSSPMTGRDEALHASATTFRRRRLGASLAVVAAVAALGLGAQGVLTGPGDVPASAAGAGTATSARTVRAEPGDSLWSIARQHRGPASTRRYLDALVDLNGGSTAIQAGQLVRLP